MGEWGGGGTLVGNGVVVGVGRELVGGLTNVVLHDRLEPYIKSQIQHTTLLSR